MSELHRRTSTDQPVLSWCLIVRNAEETLEATLKSIRERTPEAEVVIVDTCSSDSTPEIAKRYADVFEVYKGPNGDWDTEMPWFTDAAAARQRSFELAHGKFRGWIDADDRLAGPEEAKKLLMLNKMYAPPNPNGKVEGSTTLVMGLEDILMKFEEKAPEADCFWAPYLYQRDADGHALVWQERERIVKWDPRRWRWSEKAHELLVPIGPMPPRVVLSHLLFVHEKKFTKDDYVYSLSRHYDVLKKQYDAGDKTSRRAMYLADYAKVVDPSSEEEYIDAIHKCATTSVDRYRGLMAKGSFYATRGLFRDALEQYGAATTLHPEICDAWFAGAAHWSKANDVIKAVDWYEKGLSCRPNANSFVSPRAFSMEFPTRYAIELNKLGAVLAGVGVERHDVALEYYDKAVQVMNKVANDPDIGNDAGEARVRVVRFLNDLKAQRHAMALKEQANFLFDNDEPLKVVSLIRSVPWNLQDHPIIIEIEKRIAPIVKHVTDEDAYRAFYQNDEETGAIESPALWLDPKTCVSRARWVGDWINLHMPNARVLELGPFDGIVAIPLLRMCPGIQYTGVDIMQGAVDRLGERVKEFGVDDRAKFICSNLDDFRENTDWGSFDVVIWFEVIEHVPNPTGDLVKLASLVAEGGRIFVTTPWGAFDVGHPPPKNSHGHARDSRGHVRAMTARDVVDVARQAGLDVANLYKDAVAASHVGDGLNAEIRAAEWFDEEEPQKIAFAVPSALWDWNSRLVQKEGIGASEEMIIYLARALVEEKDETDSVRTMAPVEVYGPVPEAEVHEGVAYWPRSQLRNLAGTNTKLVVSRSPGYGRYVDKQIAGFGLNDSKLPKILWLQDAVYPDLNAEIAEDYEKIIVVSKWHKQAMHDRHGVPLDKMEVAYNFVLPEHFLYAQSVAGVYHPLHDRSAHMPERKHDHFIYASSPDRGLVRLLEIWPSILQALPDATLDIFYGWRGCEVLGGGAGGDAWNARFEQHRKKFEALKFQKGIKQRGMVNHVEIARAFMSAGVWLYCTDFEETGCTNAVKARAGGAIPVCPTLAALNETARCDQVHWIDSKDTAQIVEACVEAVKVTEDERTRMSVQAIKEYSVQSQLPVWRKVLLGA